MSSRKMVSASERALCYVEKSSRIQLQDLRDNPGARTRVRNELLAKMIYENLKIIGRIV